MVLFVRGVVSEMSLAQMSMIIGFIKGMGTAMVIITAMIKIMGVQINSLHAQQGQ